ncbi:MAG: hypothetical protein ACREJQ_06690 [bacterium]
MRKSVLLVLSVPFALAVVWLMDHGATLHRRTRPLIGFRKPFSRILVFPGVRFLDPQERLTDALVGAKIPFQYTLPEEGRQASWLSLGEDPAIHFDVIGRVLPNTDALSLHFQALIRNGNIRAVHITCADLPSDRAAAMFDQ